MQDATKFVAACCRWPRDDAARAAVRKAALLVEDWADVRAVVSRHRVLPMVHLAINGIDTVPDAFQAWAADLARSQIAQAMLLTQECITIDRVLKAGGAHPLHIKGPVLGQQAYDSVALKFSHDLDIFVPEAEVTVAISAMESAGYRRRDGDGDLVTKAQASALVRHCKDLTFYGPSGTLIELHWKLFHTKALMAEVEGAPAPQTVTVAGAAELQTLTPDQMVPYLCVHGAIHHWMRLKWLADLSAYLNSLSPEDLARVLHDVGQSRHADALAQALKLCDTLFETEYAPVLSRAAQSLFDYSLDRIYRPNVPMLTPLGDWQLVRDTVATRHLYGSNWSAIWSLKAHLVGQDDVLVMPLPASMSWAYVVMRLPSYLIRRLRSQGWFRPRRAKA